MVEGTCYAPSEKDGSDEGCLICDPFHDMTDWSVVNSKYGGVGVVR